MKVFSVDTETTGLGGDCNLLQLAVVYVDTSDREFLPVARSWLVKLKWMCGEPFAFNMNKNLIERISRGEGHDYIDVMKQASAFIKTHLDAQAKADGSPLHFNVAGKNYAGFDSKFLRWKHGVEPGYRTIDVGSMYCRMDDRSVPGLQKCCERLGITYDETRAHEAEYDATLVAECVYKFHGD